MQLKTEQQFLDALRNSPAIAPLMEAHQRAQLQERLALAAALAAVDRQAEAQMPKLTAAAAAAHKEWLIAEEAARSARQRLGAANNARTGASATFRARREEIEIKLRATAEPAIGAFIEEMRDDQVATRKAFAHVSFHRFDRVSGKRVDRTVNNGESVNGRIMAAAKAIEEADAMLYASDQSTVAARLAELKAALPPIRPPVIDGDK